MKKIGDIFKTLDKILFPDIVYSENQTKKGKGLNIKGHYIHHFLNTISPFLAMIVYVTIKRYDVGIPLAVYTLGRGFRSFNYIRNYHASSKIEKTDSEPYLNNSFKKSSPIRG